MANFFNKLKKIEIITIIIIYSIFIIIGLFVFKDYGVSVDEWELRVLGFANLKYIIGTILHKSTENLDKILSIPNLSSYLGTHGALFALPTAYLEYFFNHSISSNWTISLLYIEDAKLFIISSSCFFCSNELSMFFIFKFSLNEKTLLLSL